MNSVNKQSLANLNYFFNIKEGKEGGPMSFCDVTWKIILFIGLNLITIVMYIIYSILKAQNTGAPVQHVYTVGTIQDDKWPAIKKMIEEWKRSSEKKLEQIFGPNWPSCSDTDAGKLFLGHMSICDFMIFSLEAKIKNTSLPGENWDTVFVACDSSINVQSIALYDYSQNHLSYILTHPNNLKNSINTSQARGSATAIMNYLKRASDVTGRALTLTAAGPSEEFYKKLGFTSGPAQETGTLMTYRQMPA